MFTLDDLRSQLGQYVSQKIGALKLVEQAHGAIAAIEHQIKLVEHVMAKNEAVAKQLAEAKLQEEEGAAVMDTVSE